MAYCKTCSDEIPEGCSYCVSCMNDNRGQADTQDGFEDQGLDVSEVFEDTDLRLAKKVKEMGLKDLYPSLGN